jgi:hypothetical protein
MSLVKGAIAVDVSRVPDRIKLRLFPIDRFAQTRVSGAGYKCILDLTLKVRVIRLSQSCLCDWLGESVSCA